jgi:hypothetical protein
VTLGGRTVSMIRRLTLAGAVAAGVTLSPSAARACPVCHTETGSKVRAGIFGEDFGSNLLLTLLPFPVLAGLVLLAHYAFPNPKAENSPRRANTAGGES